MVLFSPSAPRFAYQGGDRRDTARPTNTNPRESKVRTKQCGLEPKWLRKPSTFLEGLQGPRGHPDPKNGRFPIRKTF